MHEVEKKGICMNRLVCNLLGAALLAGFALPSLAQSSGRCEIADVVFMIKKERMKPDQVRKECGSSVRNAGSCTMTRILRLADEGMDEDDIADQCRGRRSDVPGPGTNNPRVASICATPAGACPMVVPV